MTSSARRFYETFGYVVFRNAFDKNLLPELIRAYDDVVATHPRHSDMPIENPDSLFGAVICGAEQSQPLLTFIQNSRILPLVEEILGEDALFWGSDFSIFRRGSDFHRDMLGDFKFLKACIYLQDSTELDGGQFVCIPGSHHYGDSFTRLSGQGLRWPKNGAGYEPAMTGEIDLSTNNSLQVLPTAKIDIAVGDILFFDQALVHAVPASNRLRRQLALNFFEGEKSFNGRARVSGEFSELNYEQRLAAYRIANYICSSSLGREVPINYHQTLFDMKIERLVKHLYVTSREQLLAANADVIKGSRDIALRLITGL